MKDYGDLVAVTAAIHTPLGVGTAPDLTFSNGVHGQVASGGGGGGTLNAPVAGGTSVSPSAQGLHATPTGGVSGATHGPSGAGAGGAASPGGGGGGGGAGGGTLPFTGFSLAVPATLGAAMTAAGMALRRVLRRRAG